jgi:predicted nucleotide-binding protein
VNYVAFSPGTDVRAGDWLEATISGERRIVTDVSSPVVRGRVFMVRADCLTELEYANRGGHPRGKEPPMTTPTVRPDPRKVFVVFGRNHEIRDEIYTFLNALGLRHIEFDDAARDTGEGSPTIDRVLDAAFDLAQAVIVLLTGDDEARLREHYRKAEDQQFEGELTPQPRPNVLFEAGMAFGRHSERVILLQVGTIRPFSDVAGRYLLRFTGSTEDRVRLKDRLKTAGCNVDETSLHWYKAGRFAPEAMS